MFRPRIHFGSFVLVLVVGMFWLVGCQGPVTGGGGGSASPPSSEAPAEQAVARVGPLIPARYNGSINCIFTLAGGTNAFSGPFDGEDFVFVEADGFPFPFSHTAIDWSIIHLSTQEVNGVVEVISKVTNIDEDHIPHTGIKVETYEQRGNTIWSTEIQVLEWFDPESGPLTSTRECTGILFPD